VLAGVKAAGRTPEDITSVLDFGSGYGRVYRALAAGFPGAQLTACDLMADAAKFCATTFGGDWVVSNEDLAAITLPRRYDLVWLGSVFTHLPAHRWHMLLDFLADATATGGLVVFTTHGENAIRHMQNVILKRNPHFLAAERLEATQRSLQVIGFDFVPNKPAAIQHQQKMGISVTQGEYGLSFGTEWWIRKVIDHLPQWEVVRYAAPGWAGNHDAVTLRRLA
jgi:SAM-dependent methyltransferase